MSEVIDLEQYRRSAPPLVFVDMFQGQLSGEEGFGVRELAPVLAKCRHLLAQARARHWPVAFVRPPRVSSGPRGRASRWIEGFEPRRTDMVFDRVAPSCYTSEEFADAMDDAGRVFVLAGFSVESACLATLIDAAPNNHFVGLVRDASATRPLPGHDAAQSHAAVVTVASRFGTIVTADHWIDVAAGTAEPTKPRSNVSLIR
jgi:nicotinamidase-related amidase